MTATDDERRIQPGSNRESARGLSDEQIFCPFCHYNLTANESGRCPECGSFFDREILLRAAAEEARFVMPWDSPEEMPLLRRFWDTLVLTWFDPHRFSLAFGAIRRRSRAGSFSIICLGLIGAIIFTCSGIGYAISIRGADSVAPARAAEFVLSITTPLAILISFSSYVLLLLLITSALLAIGVRHGDGSRHFRPWWTICRYSIGHFTLLAPVPVVTGLMSVVVDLDFDISAMLVGFSFLIGVVLLWTATLRHVVRERAGRSGKLRPRHRVLGGLIGVTGLLATILGGVVTVFAVEMVTRYVRYNW